MKNFLFLAFAYARFHRLRTLTLVSAITIICALPLIVSVGIRAFEKTLSARAQTSPLVIGAPGGRFDLLLSALYYRQGKIAPLRFDTYEKIQSDKENSFDAFPLFAAHTAGNHPLVGTTLEYLDFRNLRVNQGRMMSVIGEVVLGASAAQDLNLKAGDTLLTDQESLFDLAKNLPLRLHVVGILEKTNTPDDGAIFCDLKTSWIVAGLGHGHDDVAKVSASQLLKKDDVNLAVSAAVRSFVEVTPENLASFHFHGEQKDFPLSCVLIANASPKAHVLLKTKWNNATTQALASKDVVVELLQVVFSAQKFFNLGLLIVAGACALVLALVFNLSLRLRESERDTLTRIGAAPSTVVLLLWVELVLVIGAGLLIAAVLMVLAMELMPWITGKML